MITPYATVLPLALALALSSPLAQAAAATTIERPPPASSPAECAELPVPVDTLPRRGQLDIDYPKEEAAEMGEGFVRLAFNISSAGSTADIQLIDAIGPASYVHAAIAAIQTVKFEPAMAGGKPVDYYDWEFESVFRIEGKNRGAVHDWTPVFYHESDLRKNGDFAGSAAMIKGALNEPLNLYEMATLSYDLALDYIGMYDYARALIAIRHATLEDEQDLAKPVRPWGLARRAELEARTHNYAAALCSFATLMQTYPDFAPSAELEGLIAAARADLAGSGPLRTEVELVESGRADIAPRWVHHLVRRAFRFERIDGPPPRFRRLCTTSIVDGPAEIGRVWKREDIQHTCTLHVLGDAGVKFVLIEE